MLSQQFQGSSHATQSAQAALQPTSQPLQVEESFAMLREVVEFHSETVRALLRRLEPATGEVLIANAGLNTGVAKVPMASSIDYQRDAISTLTAEVQATIRALQF